MLSFFIFVNLFLLLPVLIIGLILSVINNFVAKKLNTPHKWWIYTVCGFVGTPIHELSHAFFNVIFFHKITKISLYRPIEGRKDGILGFVDFKYNKKSIYQNIGLFFTGIGPIIGGSLVLYLLLYFLLPNVFNNLQFFNVASSDISLLVSNFKLFLTNNLTYIWNVISLKQYDIINLIIFSFLAFSITTHMDISLADLKSAIKGIVVIELIILIVSILFYSYNILGYIQVLFTISSYIITFLTLGLAFSLISFLITLIISIFPN